MYYIIYIYKYIYIDSIAVREDLAAEQREYTTLAFYIHACVLKKADETNE